MNKLIREEGNLKKSIEHTIKTIRFISNVADNPLNYEYFHENMNKFNRQMRIAEKRYGLQTDKYYEMIQGN